MNLHEETGLSVYVHQIHNPLYYVNNTPIAEITDRITSYTHTKGARGGNLSATITLSVTPEEAQEWYTNGLGRRIVVHSAAGHTILQVFVNLVTVVIGALAAETRGPLMDIGNRVSAVYTPYDATVYPPVTGATTVTIINEDTVSQAWYTIFEKVVNAGTCTPAEAEQARDTYLMQRANPPNTGDLSFGAVGEISVTLDCLGYYHRLSTYIYNDFTSGYTTITDKIRTILQAEPSSLYMTNWRLDDNLYLVPYAETQNRFALTIIDEMLAIGDIYDERWLFGIDDHRTAYLYQMPTVVEYQMQIADSRQRVMQIQGGEVAPWLVQAGKWIEMSDWLANQPYATAGFSRSNPRYKFIESVQYVAPWDIMLQGGNASTLPQLLAKTGGSI